jgi:hypothetical protein
MMDGITGTLVNIVGKETMMYKQYQKILDKHKRDIETVLNFTCELCNQSYVTTWDAIKYCPTCIDDLEREVNEEMFGE